MKELDDELEDKLINEIVKTMTDDEIMTRWVDWTVDNERKSFGSVIYECQYKNQYFRLYEDIVVGCGYMSSYKGKGKLSTFQCSLHQVGEVYAKGKELHIQCYSDYYVFYDFRHIELLVFKIYDQIRLHNLKDYEDK